MSGKIWVCCVIVIGCTLTGHAFSRGAERRYRLVLELTEAMYALKIQMTHLMEPVERALGNCSCGLLAEVAGKIGDTVGVYEAWIATLGQEERRGGKADCLGGEEREILDRLFSSLGKSDAESQNRTIEACAGMLKKIGETCREKSSTARRLYGTMGFLTGMAIVVLMI